jgi:hypothetical protein
MRFPDGDVTVSAGLGPARAHTQRHAHARCGTRKKTRTRERAGRTHDAVPAFSWRLLRGLMQRSGPPERAERREGERGERERERGERRAR